MSEILAVFRSRSQAIDCNQRLRAFSVSSQLINTPKEANVGCGLSVKFPQGAAQRAKGLITRLNYSSFYGYMKMDMRGGRYYIKGF